MRVSLGAGWTLTHLTDRTVELRKDDVAYRRFTGADGYVFVRGEPGMDRAQLIQLALESGRHNDEELAKRVAKQLMPTTKALAKYKAEQAKYQPIFQTPEDPGVIGVKRA